MEEKSGITGICKEVLTMTEYIEREKAKRLLHIEYAYAAEQLLDEIPAADVAPVVHGRWVHLGGDEWCCSACGFVISTEGSWEKPTKKYCEDCGVKMDEDYRAV